MFSYETKVSPGPEMRRMPKRSSLCNVDCGHAVESSEFRRRHLVGSISQALGRLTCRGHDGRSEGMIEVRIFLSYSSKQQGCRWWRARSTKTTKSDSAVAATRGHAFYGAPDGGPPQSTTLPMLSASSFLPLVTKTLLWDCLCCKKALQAG